MPPQIIKHESIGSNKKMKNLLFSFVLLIFAFLYLQFADCTRVYKNTGYIFLNQIVGFNPDYIVDGAYGFSLNIWIKSHLGRYNNSEYTITSAVNKLQKCAGTQLQFSDNAHCANTYNMDENRYENNRIVVEVLYSSWTINYPRSHQQRNYQIGNGMAANYLLQDFIFYKVALSQAEMVLVANQCGNVKVQFGQMVRYYKLLHYGDGLIVYDFSKYEVHYKFRVINPLDQIWVTDPEMEKQIAFASTKAHSDPDFFKLAVDDFTNSQRFVRKPAYPLIYSNLNVEFWFKFIPPADITPYEFVFIHDQTNPSNFKIYTLPGNTTAICYKIIGATDCSQFSTSLLINTGRWAYYSFQYVSKIQEAYQIYNGYISTNIFTTPNNQKFQFAGDFINFASILTSPPSAGTFTCLMKELRFWNNQRSFHDVNQKALGAHWSAMIGYWPLTPESFGFNFLLDYSMNSQLVALPSNLKFRGEYDDSLTLCKPEWAYDNTKKICIELASLTTQTAPDFYQNGQWVFKLDSNGKINVALELWFYPIFQNFTIFRKEDSLLTVKGFQNLSPLQNGIILEKSQIPSLNALTNYPYAPGHWTHLMVQSKNLGGGNIQYNVCICRVCYDPMVLTSGATLNANALIAEFYQGSIREVRVWDISLYNGFSFFYKRQILYPQEEETLLDYWRMEADDNNVYTHYNNPLGFLYLQNYHIAPNIPVALYPKLGECKYGASFSGYSCQYNDIIPENINTASSIEIITINQTTPLPSYSVGFWFKFPNQIDQNIVCGIPPDPKNFIFLSLETQSTVQYLMLRQNGCEFTVALTSTFFSQKWYQIVATKWDVSSTARRHVTVLTQFYGQILTQLTQTELTCPNYAFANGTGFGSVILGCGVNMQKGASVRNFFLTPYAMSQNDVILTTRVSWKMLKFRMISYIPFNETRNDWFYDIANPFLIGNYRNGQGHYLVHDSYLPIICDDLYESMNFDTQMCDQKKIANFAQNQEILLQVGKLNSVWNPNYQMCFGFYLRVLHQGNNSEGHILTFNPSASNINEKLQISYLSQMSGSWPIISIKHSLEGNSRQYFSTQRIQTWGHVAVVRGNNINVLNYNVVDAQQYKIFDYGNSDFGISTAGPLTGTFNFDQQILIGKSLLPTFQGLQGLMRQLTIFSKQCTQNDVYLMMTLESTEQYLLAHYFTFEENTYHGKIYDYGWATSSSYSQQNINTLSFDSYQTYDQFNWDYTQEVWAFGTYPIYTGLVLPSSVNWCLNFNFYSFDDWSIADKILFVLTNFIKITRLSNGQFEFIFYPSNFSTKSAVTHYLPIDRWHTFGLSRTAVGSTTDMYMFIDDIQYIVLDGKDMPAVTSDIQTASSGLAIREIKISLNRCSTLFIRQLSRKIIDGEFYTGMIHYQPNFFSSVHRKIHRIWQNGVFQHNKQFQQISTFSITFEICPQDQYYDGVTCSYFYYMYFRNDLVKNFALPVSQTILPDDTIGCVYYQLDFWVLFIGNVDPGDLIRLDLTGTSIQLSISLVSDNLHVIYQVNGVNQRTVVGIFGANIINDLERNWRKIHFKVECSLRLTVAGCDGKWMFTDDYSAEYPTFNFAKTSNIIICPGTCQHSIAHVALYKHYQDIESKPLENIFKRPLASEVYMYYELQTKNKDDWIIYDLSSTNYSNRLLMKGAGSQKFKWWLQKEIFTDAEELVLCSQDEEYHYIQARCQPAIVETIRFSAYYGTNQTVLKNTNPQISYNNDWTIDLWVNFKFQVDIISTSMTLIKSNCYTDMSQIAYNLIVSRTSSSKQCIMNFHFQDYGGTGGLIQEDRDISELKWIHVAVVNRFSYTDKTLKLYAQAQQPQTQNIATARSKFPSCDIVIGAYGSPVTAPNHYFYLKDLRIWNIAHNLQTIKKIAFEKSYYVGELNLVRYYRFNVFGLEDVINGKGVSDYIQGANMISGVYDNTFNMECPYGYMFNNNTGSCYGKYLTVFDNNIIATRYFQNLQQNTRVSWSNYHHIASVAEDHDLSFTMLLWTVSDANGGLDFFFIEDILEIFEFNKTHQFSFLRDGLPSISRTSVQPLSKVYISWAFMYDGESNKFMIFMEDQEIASVEIPYDELPKSSSWVTDFGALNSYRNTSMYLVRYAFFQGTISKNIITKSAKAYSDPIESTPALKSMLLFEQSNFDKFTNQYNPYDYANRDLEQSYTTHPTQKPYWAIQTINCKPGTIFNYLNCLLPQSLVLNNATQYLDTTGVKLGYSATVQFWFNIVQEGNPSQPTTLFSMQNTIFINKLGPDFTFNWANFITPGTLSQVLNTGVLNSNQWYQHTFVLYLRRICYYQDYNLINNFTDPNYQWDSVSISYIGISAPASYKIKYKEISIMGYPKSQAEIIRDRFQTIDYYMYYQSLLVYFPINESIYNKIYDLSKYARITDLLNSGVYWDFEAKSTYATNLNSQTGNDAQTKDKALFFHHGLTTPVVLPYTNLDISSIDYTLMFCFNIQSLNDIPINTKVTVIEVEYLASIILMKYSNSHVGIFYEYYPGSMPFLTLDHYLMNQWQCLIATMFGSDNFTYFMNPDVNSVGNGNSLMVNAFSFPNITASQRQIIINPFNVYLREIKLFNVGLSIGNAIRLYRQSINSQLYWGKYLASYYRMDEGFGLDILNYKNAQYFTIPDNYVGGKIAPMWSDPGSKLIICDAESKYSQTGYCQSREKFLQLPETSNHIAHLNLLDFQNITLAVWLYIKQFDNQMSGITIRHEQKYKIEINTDKSVRYTLGDYPTQSLDTRNVLRLKSWFVIFTMINKDEDFSQCSFIYSNGVSSFDHKSKKISKPWRYSSSLNVDDFYIDVSSGTKVFARDLQIWNAPLSLESFMNFRMHRGLDPISLRRQMLILYFRFDESAGQYYLSNTAQQYRHGNVWNYFKPISGENKWYYYSNLEADPTYDTETMRAQLFCREPYSLRIDTHCEYYGCDAGVQDGVCTGPQPNAYYTCNQTGNQVFSFYKRDCYDCYSNCATCNVANSFDSCTSCYSGQMLVNGICTNECPESLYYFNGTCVTCENALCKCTQENLSLCIACLNPSHYYLSDEMNCTDTVPIEQFYNEEQQVFQQCHPFCMTCDWSDQYSCLSCSNNTFDMGNKYCNSITCMDGSELLEPGIPPACTPCQAPCLTCKNLPSKCTSCDETTVLDDEGQCLPCSAIVGYDYPIKGSGASKKCTEICGDGLNFGQFPCDDGNKKDGDGCNSKCEIELQMTCGGGSPTSKDSCHDTVGPSVEIVAVSEQSKILTLQFRESQGQVFTKAKSLNESDFALIITGINGKLKYTVKAKISEQFSSTGKLTIDFNPQFSIPSQGAFVKIQFKKANQFVDQYDNHLQNTLTNKIQLKEYEFVDESTMGSIKAMGAAVSSGTTVILAVNFIASLLLDKALDAFYSALNSIQILYYLPLINIPFPQIMYTIFSYLSYATLENQLLEDPISQNINFQNIKDRPLNDAFENYNIESQVFLQLFKYKGGMLFLIFGPLPFVFILSRFKHRAFNIFKKMRKFYFFNGPLRFGYEMYLEMGIFAYLNLNNLQFKNRDQLIASTLAIIAITHITFFPLISMSLIQRFSHNFDDQYFKEKLSTLVEGTKLEKCSRLPQYHFTLFMFRRLVYIIILVLLADYPLLQIVLCVIKTLLMLCYLIIVQPFELKLTNFMQIFNESLTGVAFSMCYVFTNNMTDTQRKFYGWIIISIVSTVLIANLMVAIVETVKGVWELVYKLIGLIRNLVQKLRNKNNAQKSKTKVEKFIKRQYEIQDETKGVEFSQEEGDYGQDELNKSQIRLTKEANNTIKLKIDGQQDSTASMLTRNVNIQSIFAENKQQQQKPFEVDNFDISNSQINLRLKIKASKNKKSQGKSNKQNQSKQLQSNSLDREFNNQDAFEKNMEELKNQQKITIKQLDNYQGQNQKQYRNQNIIANPSLNQSQDIQITVDDLQTNDRLDIDKFADKNQIQQNTVVVNRKQQQNLRDVQSQYQQGINQNQQQILGHLYHNRRNEEEEFELKIKRRKKNKYNQKPSS